MIKKKPILLLLFLVISVSLWTGETALPKLSEIMKGADFTGKWPEQLVWSPDSKSFYYSLDEYGGNDIYQYVLKTGQINKVETTEFSKLPLNFFSFYRPSINPNSQGENILYSKKGNLFIYNVKTSKIQQITDSSNLQTNPFFGTKNHIIYYNQENNLFKWDRKNNVIAQITHFKKGPGKAKGKPAGTSDAQKYFQAEESKLFQDYAKKEIKPNPTEQTKKKITMILENNDYIGNFTFSPKEDYLFFTKAKRIKSKTSTLIPQYIDGSGFTKTTTARPKATEKQVFLTKYFRAHLKTGEVKEIKLPVENAWFPQFIPSPDRDNMVFSAHSADHKNAYIMRISSLANNAEIIYHLHTPEWIGHLSLSNIGWLDNKTIYFTSEKDGYSHIYTLVLGQKKARQITKGKFVIREIDHSPRDKCFYFSANVAHPGKLNLYKVPVTGGKPIAVTSLSGRNETYFSPDFKHIAILHSEPDIPWQVYLKQGSQRATLIKDFRSDSFKKYTWTRPEVISFKTPDNVDIYSRVFVPQNPHPSRPGIIFIHGAGYLQNAHYGWSEYYREYMFHNLLQQAGYHVIDVDYSGSANYGATFRTRIYRHMGGKDLDDITLAADYLQKEYGVKKIGIYGGSYGGFLTLMGMFTKPDRFTCGAALRPVTDWAHYSNWYCADILNNPLDDYEAYKQSSPIYFAEGLKGHLLICHGMIDDNVHFQDSVRLSQRLIELGKKNWELAVYPLEAHSFSRASSWTDEYGRIYKLFENTLK